MYEDLLNALTFILVIMFCFSIFIFFTALSRQSAQEVCENRGKVYLSGTGYCVDKSLVEKL